MAPLELYFDFISPYAYVVATQVHGLAEKYHREVTLTPVLFAAMLNAHGQKGPAEIPAKRTYTFKDAYRKAKKAGLPTLTPPPAHPFNPLVALRVATAAEPGPERRAVTSALYAATWGGGPGIESEAIIVSVLDAAGLDGRALVAAGASAEVKAKLRAQTDAAIAAGAFGVPTIVADGELFWGVDGFAFLDDFLAGDDPVPTDLAERWAHLPASAHRVPT